MDGREAPYLYRYRHEFVVERGEHGPGPAGLLHTSLETPDTGGDGALHCCHRLLVVRHQIGEVSTLHVSVFF